MRFPPSFLWGDEMPLVKGKSKKAFEHNIKAEMDAGKPQKQALAIAYATKRKAEHKAMGGYAGGGDTAEETLGTKIGYPGFPKPKPSPQPMAHGGEMRSKRERAMEAFHSGIVRKMAEGGMTESGYEKGINRGRRLEKGVSYAGAHQRGQVYAEPQSKEESEGYAKEQHKKTLSEMASMPKPKLMAQGGFIGSHQSDDSDPDIDGDLMPAAHLKEELAEHIHHEPTHDSSVGHDVMNQEGEEDQGAGDMDEIHPMIQKIIMGRVKGYSEGGKVANEYSGSSTCEPTQAKWEENEFDDIANRDDLEEHYTAANSGDEDGDAQEDHDRHDIVMRIMKSRAKKDRLAIPGEGSTYGKRK